MTGIPQHIIDGFNDSSRQLEQLGFDGNQLAKPQPETTEHGFNSDYENQPQDNDFVEELHDDDQRSDANLAPPQPNWEQRAKTAEGRLAAQGKELTELRRQVASLNENLERSIHDALSRREEEANARLAAHEKKAQARQQLATTLGLDDDSTRALDEYLGTFVSQSKPSATPAPSSPPPSSQPPSATADYAQAVLSAFPNYDELTNSNEFDAWKFGRDQGGITHFERMIDANSRGDASTMISCLARFVADSRANNPRFGMSANSALKNQVSPGRSRTGSQAPSNQQQHLSNEQIAKYSEQLVTYMQNGRYADAQRLQNILNASMAANKI